LQGDNTGKTAQLKARNTLSACAIRDGRGTLDRRLFGAPRASRRGDKLRRMDRLLGAADSALRTLFAKPHAVRACPVVPADETHLVGREAREAAALMRVNHVGEVCAQALYTAQALATRDPVLRQHFERAADEETDHLAWTADRLRELGDRPSLLNPLWYAGAFTLGLIAGRLGDRLSLGFVVETERQVEAHLESHLERLPIGDHASRAIVAQMKDDEAAHAAQAMQAGATELPAAVKSLMRAAAKVMTTTAHYI
jgi:3-demethoxyubiquinol 3-hydroxylase